MPALRKDELTTLAEIGALNGLDSVERRGALWESGREARPVGPLLEGVPGAAIGSPLAPMTADERLRADYHGTGVTIGRHPMAFRRAEMKALGVRRAADLHGLRNGRAVRVAGCVIVHHANLRTPEGLRKGLGYFERSVAADPRFAPLMWRSRMHTFFLPYKVLHHAATTCPKPKRRR